MPELSPAGFLAAIQAFDSSGLPVYFGVYLAFYGLSFWGLKQAQNSLPFNLLLAEIVRRLKSKTGLST